MSTNWITGKRYDLAWYIGAAISGYLLIWMNLGLGISVLLLLWFWIVAVDGPHVFGTISRTYLDRKEWQSRAKLFLGSLFWFLPGPLLIVSGILMNTPIPYFLFLVFAQLWAYWHVVRQHYGFLTLYQKKNGEVSGRSNGVDYWVFYMMMLLPFVSFLLRNPQARTALGLPVAISAQQQLLLFLLHTAIGIALILYVLKEWENVREGRSWNLPKNIFLAACIPLHLFLFLHPYVSTHVDVRAVAVFVTFYHNIQYHGIVWFYNRNRYGNDAEGKQYGLASKVSRNFLTYYTAAILFTFAYRYSNWFLMGLDVPGIGGPNWISELALGSNFTFADLAYAFWWGFAFNHYYLDQKIWKVSRDKQLSSDLRIA
jgi:hypothetical protein